MTFWPVESCSIFEAENGVEVSPPECGLFRCLSKLQAAHALFRRCRHRFGGRGVDDAGRSTLTKKR